jgi:hypothetical protein
MHDRRADHTAFEIDDAGRALTLDQAARALSLSPATIARAVEAGVLEVVPSSGGRLILNRSIQLFAVAHQVAMNAPA